MASHHNPYHHSITHISDSPAVPAPTLGSVHECWIDLTLNTISKLFDSQKKKRRVGKPELQLNIRLSLAVSDTIIS